MENLISVLKTVLPIIIAFAMGYIAKRKQIVSRSGVSDMKKFVLNITLPVSLFGIFYKAAYSEGVIVCAIVFFAVSCVGLFVGKLLCKLTREKQPLYGFMTSAFEISLLGFALYTMVFGAEHVGSMAMLDIGNEIFIVTIYAALLRSRNSVKQKISTTIIETLKTPNLMATILGVILGATGAAAAIQSAEGGIILDEIVTFIGAPTTCVILFAVGYEINISKRLLRAGIKVAVTRIIVAVGLCFLTMGILNLFMEVDYYLKWAIIMIFTLPPVCFMAMFADKAEDGEYISTCISLYIILTIIAFVVISAVAIA